VWESTERGNPPRLSHNTYDYRAMAQTERGSCTKQRFYIRAAPPALYHEYPENRMDALYSGRRSDDR